MIIVVAYTVVQQEKRHGKSSTPRYGKAVRAMRDRAPTTAWAGLPTAVATRWEKCICSYIIAPIQFVDLCKVAQIHQKKRLYSLRSNGFKPSNHRSNSTPYLPWPSPRMDGAPVHSYNSFHIRIISAAWAFRVACNSGSISPDAPVSIFIFALDID